ncbi:MAG TPA: NAD(P)/FAD-dependent oxidoreductase [Solirubrobacteraceae bacterium]|nr:NAD(P)/FAD-dependent oxidoreductase [Solirubrobacteraceae bacterium]
MTVRRTKRGADRTPLDGTTADVLVCGASFAGLAVARELAGRGADVLVVDRYEVGERATSACAAPTPWLHAMGVAGSIRQELPYMRFTTPHGSVRWRLPWSWSAFDYRALCELLAAQSDARFETAKVERRTEEGVLTDRGELRAPLVVDAMGWKRVLGDHHQPPEAPLSRGLEVHPPHDSSGDELRCWIDRGVVRRGYGWHVPAGDEVRIGVGSYDPRRHVKEATVELAEREAGAAVRFQGNWFPHRLRDAADRRTFFVGDSAGHCFPLSGEGIRTAFYFGIAAGREIAAVLDGAKPRDAALRDYAAFSAAHSRAFARALRLQRLVPALPPRLLALGLRAFSPFVDRAFTWYLDQAHPGMANAWERTQTSSRGASRRSPTATSTA